jgi:hypothetical protein
MDTAARRSHQQGAKLIRVLEATVKGHSVAPSVRLADGLQRHQDSTTSADDQPDFPP